MAKKKKKTSDPKKKRQQVHKDLEGFDIRISPLGEITSSIQIEKINAFLNENLDDLKLQQYQQKDEEE